ncbi:winged helix-turn-helix transcriptional regulator [Chitinophaga vietnamensis]|uniref:winged helix-turn-helix transcriptional regulator n=1 Tax=Chitinophaga vietnamensis TaxID=2593957 RepID=UPI0011780DFD|nr:helix-turn-helix domain-containing protein [Chitinophaga vietnamensis]
MSISLDQPENSVTCKQALHWVDDAMYVISGKWKLRIIVAMLDGHKRFNELQRKVEGISARVLSNELKELEMNDIVRKIVYAESSPVMVSYELTEYADTLQPLLRTLADWGAAHRNKIIKGQAVL